MQYILSFAIFVYMKIEMSMEQYMEMRQALITAQLALNSFSQEMAVLNLNILAEYRKEQADKMGSILALSDTDKIKIIFPWPLNQNLIVLLIWKT